MHVRETRVFIATVLTGLVLAIGVGKAATPPPPAPPLTAAAAPAQVFFDPGPRFGGPDGGPR